jgi:hypothetical protein
LIILAEPLRLITNSSPGKNSRILSSVIIRLITPDLTLTKVRKGVIIPLMALKLALWYSEPHRKVNKTTAALNAITTIK